MLKTLVNYLKEVKMEVGKIEWPTKEKVISDTQVVIVISIVIGVYLALADFGLSKAFEAIINLQF